MKKIFKIAQQLFKQTSLETRMTNEILKKIDLIEIKGSKIHNKGAFAKRDIAKNERIIEYVGEKITKTESNKRAQNQLEKSNNHAQEGGVYIFEINKKYDIDGKVSWNKAKSINHSCDPNAEAQKIKGHIWIVSIKDIKKGEEVTYNYGYDIDSYEEHPCKCGSKNCVGYILAKHNWPKLKRKLKKLNQ